MAKLNDMPELNPAKVFLANLFIKEHLKPPCQHPLKTNICAPPSDSTGQTPLQSLGVIRHETLQLTTPGYFSSAAVLSKNSDMNGFTVGGFGRDSHWLKDEPTGFAKNVDKLPA